MRLLCALLVAAPLLLASSAALANGRYPLAGQVVEDPGDPDHLVVRATYGLLITKDRGKNWGWVCEGSVGFLGTEDPMMGITHGGTVFAAIFEGLSVSTDDGCNFGFYPPLKKNVVADLAIDKVDPTTGVLAISNNAGAEKFVTAMWQTSDSGATWTKAGIDLPTEFLGLTLDSAPSDQQTVYVSGRFGPPAYQGALEKTVDRGLNWTRVDIPNSSNLNLPYIGAISPDDPGVVYVRLRGDTHDALVVTKNGGTTWKTVYHAKGALLGFALSPDGQTIAIGGDKDGLLMADTATLSFQKISDLGVRCLTWTQQGIYACADEFVDGFQVGFSKDEGKTFTPLFHLQSLCSLLPCPGDSTTTKKCADKLGPLELSVMANCGQGGGGGGATNASSATGAGGGSGGSGGSSSGCSCSTPDGQRGGEAAVALALGAAVSFARRRRRTVRPSHQRVPPVG